MAKIDKILEKWNNLKSGYVQETELLVILEEYFPDYKIKKGGSHNYHIRHDELKGISGAFEGCLSIPVKGNKIRVPYIKIVLKAINHIKEKEIENTQK